MGLLTDGVSTFEDREKMKALQRKVRNFQEGLRQLDEVLAPLSGSIVKVDDIRAALRVIRSGKKLPKDTQKPESRADPSPRQRVKKQSSAEPPLTDNQNWRWCGSRHTGLR